MRAPERQSLWFSAICANGWWVCMILMLCLTSTCRVHVTQPPFSWSCHVMACGVRVVCEGVAQQVQTPSKPVTPQLRVRYPCRCQNSATIPVPAWPVAWKLRVYPYLCRTLYALKSCLPKPYIWICLKLFTRLATSDCSHACIFFGKVAEFKRSKLVNRLEYMVALLGRSVTHSQFPNVLWDLVKISTSENWI